jgi:hypothetical protein
MPGARRVLSGFVTGVDYFDFRHGQSGVAPNAIELHPILGVKIGSLASSPPPARPKPTTPPKSPPSSGSFSVSAYVSPNPVSYGQYATLYARRRGRRHLHGLRAVFDGSIARVVQRDAADGGRHRDRQLAVAHGEQRVERNRDGHLQLSRRE